MREPFFLNRSAPLRPATPTLHRIGRGLVWAWSIALGFGAVILGRALLAGGLAAGATIARDLASFAPVAFTLMSAAGIAAAFVAPLLTGYARACFLGLLVALPMLVGLVGVMTDGTWQVGWIHVYYWIVAGAGLGALLRWRRGNNGWPVGDDWP